MEKKKINIGNILKYVGILIVLVLSVIFLVNLIKLDIIPLKFIIIISVVLAILNVISGIILLSKKKWLKIIPSLIYVFLIVLSIFGIRMASSTNRFLNKAFDNYHEEATTYHIVVLSSSKYKKLSDLNGKDISYYTFYNDGDKIISTINEKVYNADIRPHDDLYDTFINFLVGQLSAVVIDDGYLDILGETYENLDNRLRILYSFTITSEVSDKKEEKNIRPTVSHEKINKGDSINIFVSGSDSRSTKIYNKSRSDVNMIISINPKTKTILLTSIPRDYYVMVHGQTGLKDKLTHAGIYGLDRSKETVEDLFDIDIDYSIKMGFSAVVELVDIVGGIDIYSDTDFKSSHIKDWHVVKGNNYMDGKKALAYSRERYAYAGGDRHRIKNQQQVLEATLKKITSNKTLLLKYDQLLNSLSRFYITDIPRSEIEKYVRNQLNDMSSWKFISQSVDGKGSMTHTHVAPNTNLYVMIPDERTVENARSKMKEVLEAR